MDERPLQETLTSFSGLPLFLRAARSLGVPAGYVGATGSLKKRNRSLDEAARSQRSPPTHPSAPPPPSVLASTPGSFATFTAAVYLPGTFPHFLSTDLGAGSAV